MFSSWNPSQSQQSRSILDETEVQEDVASRPGKVTFHLIHAPCYLPKWKWEQDATTAARLEIRLNYFHSTRPER